MSNIFNLITDYKTLEKAYQQSQRGHSKFKRQALLFAKNETYNLLQIQTMLKNKTYEFGDYVTFMVYEPKERIINAPRYRDKIVQLALNDVLKDIYNPCFIYDSYACIDGKGTHAAVERISHFMRKAKWQYGLQATILKVDVRKFFYSIDRSILKRIYRKKLKDADVLWLLDLIIDSADQISEKGLPLGNTVSQLCANIYMNELDQYCKRRLGIKYYVRYADDICIFAPDKGTAQVWQEEITDFLAMQLNLEVHTGKTKIFPMKQGVNTLGFKMHPTHRLLRNDSKKKIKRKSKKMRRLIKNGYMSKEKAEQILNSWHGHAKVGNSHNFVKQLLARNDYIEQDHKGRLKIKEEALPDVIP